MNKISEKVLQAMMCMTRQCWEAGVAAQALLEIGEYELLELMVYDMVLRQSSDGRLCNVEHTPAVTDSSFCIPATLAVAEKLRSAGLENAVKYEKAADRNIQFLLNDAEHAEDGTLYHMIHTEEVWADSAAYLPYALALAGYYRESFMQMKGITRRLYDEKSGLYFHMWDDYKNDYLRALPWGIGNGWILTGLLRTMSVWSSEKQYKEEKETMKRWFDELLVNLLECENENHGFYDVLDDRETFEESETAAMVAYTIYRGVREGYVDEKYLLRADAIREALLKKVTKEGLVMDAASSPAFDRPGTAVECQAHVLMMEKEYEYRKCI